MLERWSDSLGLPRGFSFRTLMSTESQLLVWKGEGLPDDDLSQASMKEWCRYSTVVYLLLQTHSATQA